MLTRTYARSASSSARSTSNNDRSKRETSTSTFPPHDKPTSWARAVDAWNLSKLALRDPSRQSSAVFTTLPSMQPPDTDPAMPPPSLTAITEPAARGEEPQVFVTCANATAWPASNHRDTSPLISRMISSSRIAFGHMKRPRQEKRDSRTAVPVSRKRASAYSAAWQLKHSSSPTPESIWLFGTETVDSSPSWQLRQARPSDSWGISGAWSPMP